MVVIETIDITPNPVEAKGTITISVKLHEEYPDEKKYKNRYPHRYGKKEN